MEKDFYTKTHETQCSIGPAIKRLHMLKSMSRALEILTMLVFCLAPQPHKFTALHMAVERDNHGIIELLLSQEDINVDACDEVSLYREIKVNILFCKLMCGINGQCI